MFNTINNIDNWFKEKKLALFKKYIEGFFTSILTCIFTSFVAYQTYPLDQHNAIWSVITVASSMIAFLSATMTIGIAENLIRTFFNKLTSSQLKLDKELRHPSFYTDETIKGLINLMLCLRMTNHKNDLNYNTIKMVEKAFVFNKLCLNEYDKVSPPKEIKEKFEQNIKLISYQASEILELYQDKKLSFNEKFKTILESNTYENKFQTLIKLESHEKEKSSPSQETQYKLNELEYMVNQQIKQFNIPSIKEEEKKLKSLAL